MTTQQRFIMIVLTLCTILSGCSTQFGYRFADTFIEWQLAKYVDLSGPLEEDVDAAIDELHMWHARSELPRYRDLLEQLIADVEQGQIDAVQLFAYSNEAYSMWHRIRQRITPDAQRFLARLPEEKRRELVHNLRVRREEERDEAQEMSADERFERSYERALERADDWLGSVRAEQRQMLQRWLQEREANEQLWLAYQTAWLDRFEAVLNDPNAEDFSQQIEALFTQPERFRSVALKDQIKQNQELTIAVLVVLYQSLTPQQEQHLLEKFRDYHATLTDLINVYAASDA